MSGFLGGGILGATSLLAMTARWPLSEFDADLFPWPPWVPLPLEWSFEDTLEADRDLDADWLCGEELAWAGGC